MIPLTELFSKLVGIRDRLVAAYEYLSNDPKSVTARQVLNAIWEVEEIMQNDLNND